MIKNNKRYLYQVSQTELGKSNNGRIEDTYDLYTRGQFENKQDALDLFEKLKEEKPSRNHVTYTVIEYIIEYWDNVNEEWEFEESEILDSCLYLGIEEKDEE